METRYSRNRLYLSEQEQKLIRNYPILLGGAGIGSVIAESMLRFGFEDITIIDGDTVELSNLNRQNYVEKDINHAKVEAIKSRLESINSGAKISTHNCFITPENIRNFINNQKVAINALDFRTEVPLLFDEICQKNNIPVLHPYNLGWGALVTVIMPNDLSLGIFNKTDKKIDEVDIVDYASTYMRYWRNPQRWLEEIIEKYKSEEGVLPPPQLSIASWTAAAICTHIAFNIATNKPIKKFPEFYLSTVMGT